MATLPAASWQNIICATCWGGLRRAVVMGGVTDEAKTLKCRAFNEDDTTTDLLDNPGTGEEGSGLYADGGRGQCVGVYSNCDLFVCGLHDSDVSNKCFRFQVSDQSWHALPDMIGDVNFCHQVFAFGLADGTIVAALEKGYTYQLDAAGTTWTDITNPDPDMGGNYFGACRLSDGRLFFVCDVFSGYGNPITLHCFIYDAGVWSTPTAFGPFSVTDMQISDLHVVPLDNGRALVVVGLADNTDGHDTRAYLFDGEALAATGNPSTARSLFGAAGSYAGEAFIIGGRTAETTIPTPVTDSIERYDAEAGTWASFGTLTAGIYSPAAIVVPSPDASLLVVVGGIDTNGDMVDTVETYAAAASEEAGSACACANTPACDLLVFDTANPCGEGGADALGQWYDWKPPGSDPRAACMHGGVFHYLDDDGRVRYEVDGQFFDDATTPILPRMAFAPLSLGNIQGLERVYRVQAEGRLIGANTLRLTANVVRYHNADPVVWTRDVEMTDAELDEFEFRPQPEHCTNFELVFEEVESAELTGGWAFRLVTVEVGIEGKLRVLNVGQRVT